MIDFVLVSDLHIDENQFDISVFNNEYNNTRILLNLGDTFTSTEKCIPSLVSFMNKVSRYFKYSLFCLGNHDFYGMSIDEAYQAVHDELKKYNNPKLIFLDGNTIFHIPDTNISVYGDTLWSYMPPQSKEQNIEDYLKIKSGCSEQPHLKFFETNRINEISLKNIKDFLNNNDGRKKVVATHFPPKYYDQGYPISWLTSYFHNDHETDKWFGEEWMKEVYWLHGHNHNRTINYYMGTTIITNARGYFTKPEYFPILITVDD